MTLHADAIYEGGVLRPLAPLDLPEKQVVSLEISPAEAPPETEGERQRRILLDFIAHVEANPLPDPGDGLSNRDHDQIIYGNIK
jgi:predicted DNA-binding antitoxin AbrB/MazE fold protein